MKNIINKAFMLMAAMMLLVSFSTVAQQMPELPVDENVRIGKLDNGLTYYIRHNETPKGQADFYIAQKVGSVLEEENQRGLAHFLEHMCFNGTTNFPGNGLRDWLEGIGVKFGANLNAYTSVDETVYNISNVPVERESVQDSCLLILHDWANDLTLDPAEIDKERGVIHEEWRRSMAGQMRILENILPTVYPGERYGVRLPIGTMEVVDNFPYQALRDYYETWYRPDQQGIIVVGDIDVDRIEAKIKEMFSSIEMPENAKPREYFPVADNEGTIYAIGSDKEQTNSIALMFIKQDVLPKEMRNTPAFYMQEYVNEMITSMMNSRLSEIASKPDSPFAQASLSYGEFFIAKTKDALDLTVVGKDNDIRDDFSAAYRELLRAARGGFTLTEYERAQKEYLSDLETKYNNREKRESGEYVNEYVRNFIDGNPIPGIEVEYQLVNMIAPQIPVAIINQAMQQYVTENNRVVACMLPEKEGYVVPTNDQMAEVMAAVDAETIEPYVDEVKSEPLIPELPAPGKIVSEEENAALGFSLLTLSNGMKVAVKPTKFKEDEILINFNAKGGLSMFKDEDAANVIFQAIAMQKLGFGSYTDSDMTKYLQGKQIDYDFKFQTYNRTLSFQSTPRDLATAMEIIYMSFVDPTVDAAEFEALQKMYAGILANQEANPQYVFVKEFLKSTYPNSECLRQISAEIIEKANRDRVVDIIKTMTANPGDFDVEIVGNVDMETLRPLLEQYVASLTVKPEKSVKVEYNDALLAVQGKTTDNYDYKMETPQVWAYITMVGHMDYTAKSRNVAYVAGQVIGNRFLKKVREEMGATYSISARSQLKLEDDPRQNCEIYTAFPCNPDMSKDVLAYINQEFEDITSNITETEVSEQVQFLVKNAKENLEKNDFWMRALELYVGDNIDIVNGDIETTQSITVADVQNFFKELKAQGNYRVFTLSPAAE